MTEIGKTSPDLREKTIGLRRFFSVGLRKCKGQCYGYAGKNEGEGISDFQGIDRDNAADERSACRDEEGVARDAGFAVTILLFAVK